MQIELVTHWHHLPVPEVLDLLETDETKGLDTFEVEHRQGRFGPNVLTPSKGRSPLLIFLLQFHQPLVYILLASVVITSLLREWVDASVIFGVVLVNAIIGYIQEHKATKAIEALARAMDMDANVLRSGETSKIPASELVPGDIVLLHTGDKVPADLRLLRCRELQVDESSLTGESVPVHKHTKTLTQETVLADRGNIAYSSTLVTYGTARGVVIATGDQTEIGLIQEMLTTAEVLATPLTRRIDIFSKALLWVIIAMAVFTFAIGVSKGESLFDMFMAAIALAVGAIPEGLPAALTITLAIGVARMAKCNAIIRKLPAVETLGSTTIICSDKTGTLTQNQMTVQEIYAGNELFSVSGIGYAPKGVFTTNETSVHPVDRPALRECLIAGLLCSNAHVSESADGWQVEGNPTEGALVSVAGKSGLSAGGLSIIFPRLDEIPFESQHQYMATLHNAIESGVRRVYIKGSAERILERCHDVLQGDLSTSPLDIDAVHRQMTKMATKGLRVIALARMDLADARNHIEHGDISTGLTFLGLQGMIDPPRPEAIRAVKACHRAGIQVKMITGDHIDTAMTIAQQLGLYATDDKQLKALSGHALGSLSDAELIEQVEGITVFARVSPEQKLRLVEALQARGHIVAMTGDGVNDAPALRKADIGIAMGISGTEVAKEAADMVLTNDNFSTIEAAVEEGRGVYDNLIKFITWTLPTNIGEGLVILVAIFAGLSLPITPVQILWINMTTAILLGLMLAFECKESGIMNRPPRDPKTQILTKPLLLRISLVGILLLIGAFGLFTWELMHGENEVVARTVAVNVFVFGELFYLFNCRSLTRSMFSLGVFSNHWLLAGVAGMVLCQIIYTYMPAMNRIFGSTPLGVREWLLIIGTGFIIYTAVGLEKWLRR